MDITNRRKKDGPPDNKGAKFQIQLVTMVLLNAFKKLHDWKLSADNEQTGELSNVVLEWSGGRILLQAKHSKKKHITFNDLLSSISQNDDFSIAKWFLYYQRIKEKYPEVDVVICTNAVIKTDETNEQFLQHQTVSQESVLYCHGDSRFCTFNETIIPVLRETVRNYCSGSTEKVNTDDITDFLKHLQFSYNYPTEKDLDNIIERLLYGNQLSDALYKKSSAGIVNEVTKWFENLKVDEHLTESHASAIFCKMRSQKFCEILNGYGVSFKTNECNFDKTKNIFHVVTERGYLLQTIKIFRALQINETNALYINPDDDVHLKSVTVEAFKLLDYPLLVIIWPDDIQEVVLKEISTKLRETVAMSSDKRIVVIGKTNDRLIREIKPNVSDIIRINAQVAFDDLTGDSQERILNKEFIVFQGIQTSLKKLFGVQTHEFYKRAVDSEIVEKMVREEEIKVGSVVRPLDEEIACYYVSRRFVRDTEDEEYEETYSEENIYEVNDKFVIIENRGGMGKSTVLTNLAAVIKQKHPHLWVFRIQFDEYKDILKEFQKMCRDTISVEELLDFRDATKLKTDFEKTVFSVDKKVALILDAVDEISDDVYPYLQLILSLFEQCRDAPNIAKVFVASREHAIQALTEKLGVTPFKLLPFEQQDYIDFFVRFWTSKLSLTESEKSKCRIYAAAVVNKMGLWMDPDFISGDHLDVVPLELKMIAEIFQGRNRFVALEEWDGCYEFLNANKPRPILPKKINIADLFNKLIEMTDNEMTVRKYKECLARRKML